MGGWKTGKTNCKADFLFRMLYTRGYRLSILQDLDSATRHGAGGKWWHWVLSSSPEFTWRAQDSSWPVPSAQRYFCMVQPDAGLNWSEGRGYSFHQCILTCRFFFTMSVDASGQHRTSEIILTPWKINQLKPKQWANWEKQRLFFFKKGDLKSSSALFFQIVTSLLGVPDILQETCSSVSRAQLYWE